MPDEFGAKIARIKIIKYIFFMTFSKYQAFINNCNKFLNEANDSDNNKGDNIPLSSFIYY